MGATKVGRSVQFAWLVNNYEEAKEYFGDLFVGYVNEMLDGFIATAHLPTDISELQVENSDYLLTTDNSAITTLRILHV